MKEHLFIKNPCFPYICSSYPITMKRIVFVQSSIFFLVFAALFSFAQERGMKPVQITIDGSTTTLYNQSHALLIGVSDYPSGLPSIPGVQSDITAVRTALENNGFDVTVVMNPNRSDLDNAFNDFIEKYGQNVDNRLLFYFAGHGYTKKMSYGDDLGFLLPADAIDPNKNPNTFQSKALPMTMVETYALQIQSKHALFLFDACFSGAVFSPSRAIPEVISYKTKEPVRQFITSGSANETVPDKSIFRDQFIRALKGEADGNEDGYLTGTELGEFLQTTVVNYSYGSQHPQYGKIRNANLDKGDFVFILVQNPSTADFPMVNPVPKEEAYETDFWEPEMVFIQGGTFQMGSIDGESDEKPVYTVNVGNFYLGKYEVTVAQFKQFINETGYQTNADKDGGSYMLTGNTWEKRSGVTWKCDAEGNLRSQGEYNHPVVHVSWNDATEYCNWLSRKTGRSYRLPTEPEWEYAAGNGAKHSKYSWGHGDPNGKNGGNVADESAKRKFKWAKTWSGYDDGFATTAPVGSFNPNDFGLYDMTGNVWEWCSDWYEKNYYYSRPSNNPKGNSSGTYKALRGGSWNDNPSNSRSANRSKDAPVIRSGNYGFRVAMSE
ncbi:hypothetical protein D4S03_04085 [bacterium]|nr:MAG: hypothetical protein D4S03_04085 [bacterium]